MINKNKYYLTEKELKVIGQLYGKDLGMNINYLKPKKETNKK